VETDNSPSAGRDKYDFSSAQFLSPVNAAGQLVGPLTVNRARGGNNGGNRIQKARLAAAPRCFVTKGPAVRFRLALLRTHSSDTQRAGPTRAVTGERPRQKVEQGGW